MFSSGETYISRKLKNINSISGRDYTLDRLLAELSGDDINNFSKATSSDVELMSKLGLGVSEIELNLVRNLFQHIKKTLKTRYNPIIDMLRGKIISLAIELYTIISDILDRYCSDVALKTQYRSKGTFIGFITIDHMKEQAGPLLDTNISETILNRDILQWPGALDLGTYRDIAGDILTKMSNEDMTQLTTKIRELLNHWLSYNMLDSIPMIHGDRVLYLERSPYTNGINLERFLEYINVPLR